MAARKFFTGAVALIGDQRPSALDLRVYACVSLHDGMSLVKGKGAGCYASNLKLAGMIGCDYTSLSKSLSRLVTWGYLLKERHAEDRRCTTYRCVFDFPDGWSNGQVSGQPIVGDPANDPLKVVGRDAAEQAKVVGRPSSETRENQPKTAQHYIPLKGELDSVETEELDSPKVRVADAPRVAARCAVSFRDVEPINETLAKFERQWKTDWTVFRDRLPEWRDWLYEQAEAFAGDDVIASNRAMRLSETVDNWIDYCAWETGEANAR
jgi:hypothetical protein